MATCFSSSTSAAVSNTLTLVLLRNNAFERLKAIHIVIHPRSGKFDGRLFPASTCASPIPFPPGSAWLSLLTAMEKYTKSIQRNSEADDREVQALFHASEEASANDNNSVSVFSCPRFITMLYVQFSRLLSGRLVYG